MPSLSQYANVQREDQNSVQSWLCAHWFRHQTYAYAASKSGVATPPYDFSTYPDQDWLGRHMQAHYALQSFMAPDQTVSLSTLQTYTWDDDANFSSFMQMHTLIHLRLDEGFGIF